MERFVIIVNDSLPLAIITKRSMLDFAAVLDPPLNFNKHPKFIIIDKIVNLQGSKEIQGKRLVVRENF